MKIYRYEKEDGGGPWCTLDGVVREKPTIKFNDIGLYGCESLEKLKEYFSNVKPFPQDLQLKIYDVPVENIISKTERQIIFIP